MRRLISLLLLALSLLPPGAAVAQQAPATPPTADAQRLRPGDTVRLQIYREPDLSRDYPVDENGIAVFPKIGRVQVSEETAESLEVRLIAAYRRFLRDPNIDVTVLRRVQVLGAVRNPGLFPVDATIRVADALALAGGATPEGDPKRVYLIRDGRRESVRLSADTPLSNLQIRSGDQLFVPERPWWERNPGIVVAGASALLTVLLSLGNQ